MPQFRTILFPVDFSDRCRGAARYAVAMAGRFRSQLALLHVVETAIARPGELDFGALAFESDIEARVDRAREMLNSFLTPEAVHIEVTRHVERGDPARCIVRFAGEHHADLIMMPTHGYGAFRRFILGSVTAKVLHDAEFPVWTGVHLETAPELDNISVRRVLCAIDLTHDFERPLRFSADFADEYGADLAVVHAVPSGEAMPERYLDNELRLRFLREAREQVEAKLLAAGVQAHIFLEGGEVAKVVRRAAEHHRSDLMVIGRGVHTGLGRLRTHSYAIIRESPCPVISV